MHRVRVDPLAPEPAAIGEAAVVLRAGGVVAVPTDTLYGLAVDPRSEDAVARLFTVKDRARERAMALIAADLAQVIEWIGRLPPLGEHLASRYWPGPLTLLLPKPHQIVADVTGGSERVGVRVPDHAVARAICRLFGAPVTATSANLSGQPASADPDDVARTLAGRIDMLVDAGTTMGGPPSTIVDVTGTRPRLVRPGAIPWTELEACVDPA